MDFLPIKRALLSVTDKTGLIPFAAFLAQHNVQLISTGGTYKAIADNGLAVTQVSDVTRFPEIMGGRVKTLHPAIHGGILADKDNPEHLATLAEHAIEPLDLVCVNLYNFAEAANQRMPLQQAIEQIDIGGPCMLRAAAKNYHSVLVVPGAAYYDRIMEALRTNAMQAPLGLRKDMAQATFAATSAYDGMISAYMNTQ